MISNISNALNAYQQALGRIGGQAQKTEAEAVAVPTNTFGNMVKSAVDDVAAMHKQSEQVTVQGIQGKADIQDVVLAVSNAEMALETVVAVRDTAIKAYNTIMQMPM